MRIADLGLRNPEKNPEFRMQAASDQQSAVSDQRAAVSTGERQHGVLFMSRPMILSPGF